MSVTVVGDYLKIEKLVRERPSVSNFEKAITIFPTSVMFWSSYLDFLLENPEKALRVAERAVVTCVHIDMWKRYFALIKSVSRVQGFFNLYEKALAAIGPDSKSTDIWLEYLYILRVIFNTQMLASFNMTHADDASRLPPTAFLIPMAAAPPPGLTEDMVHPEGGISEIAIKPTVALIREVFQNALSVPMERIDAIWDDYQAFEQVVASALGAMAAAIPVMPGMPSPPQAQAAMQAAKLLAEFSNRWILSKQGLKQISRIYTSVNLYFAPIPLERASAELVKANILAWRRVLSYEKSNPFKLNAGRFHTRMVFVFRQCLMSNCFVSEFWLEYFTWSLATRGFQEGVSILEKAVYQFLANDVLLRLVIAYVYEETEDMDEADKVFRDALAHFTSINRPVPSLLLQYIRFKGRCGSTTHARTAFLDALTTNSIHINEEVCIAFGLLELRVFANPVAAVRVLKMTLAKYEHDASAKAAVEAALNELLVDLGEKSRTERVGGILECEFAEAQERFKSLGKGREETEGAIEIDDETYTAGGMRRPDTTRMQPFKQAMEYEEGGDSIKIGSIAKSLKTLLQILPRCGSETVPETDNVLKALQKLELPAISVATYKRLDEDPLIVQMRREREEAGKSMANLKRLQMDDEKKDDDVIIKSDLADEDRAQREFLTALASNIHRERVYYKRHKLVLGA